MRLLCQFVIRVTVCVDRPVKLLECHQSGHKLVVSIQECSKPLLRFYVLDLSIRQHKFQNFDDSQLTYRKILRRRSLQLSKLWAAFWFSEILSFSRLINLSAFKRLVDATDESAMQLFIASFSTSRLNALGFFLLDFLSFLDFFVAVGDEDELKKDGGGVALLLDWATDACLECRCVGGSGSSSLSSSASKGFCSVSRSTFDLS